MTGRSTTQISDAELSSIDPSHYNVIGAIARGQVMTSDPTYVEVKPDRRMPPFVSHDHPGIDMSPKVLLIEVDDPDDSATVALLKERLGLPH